MRKEAHDRRLPENTRPHPCGFQHGPNIPAEAHGYQIDGRTPLEWFIDRYRIGRDKESSIVNDPNGWFADPRYPIASIRRIVQVGVGTARIVASQFAQLDSQDKGGVLAALRRSPLVGADIDLTRARDEGRAAVL